MAFQGDSIYWVEVEKVVPNPFQPRREFDQNKLQELADSIRMYGVLQPLTVTRKEVQQDSGTFYTEYELIAGERRLRASKLAGVAQVPVIIREGEQSEQEKLELAIIENLQREDLNAVDRAIAFKQLAEAFGLSHAQVAQKVGRSREYVSNSIRLLGLPDHMLESLKHGDMMEGHARTLLMLTDRPEEQEVVYKEILLKKLSVREVERIVRKIATDKVRKKQPGELDSNLIEFEKQFTETLGTRVQIQKTDFGGKLTIDYFSTEDLEGILERMKDEEKRQAVLSANDEVSKLKEHTPLDIASENTQPAASVAPETTVPKLEVTPETSEMLASETAVVKPGDDFKQPEKSELPVATPETVIPKTEEVPGRSLVNQPSQNPVEPNSPEPLSEIPSAPVSPNSEIKQTVQYGYGNQENSHTQSQFVPRELENRTEAPIDPAVKTEDRRPAEPIVEQPIRPAAFSVPQYQPSVQVGYTNPQAEQANTELIKPDTAVSPVPPTPAQSRSPEMETEKLADSDESDMYSVRNFGV